MASGPVVYDQEREQRHDALIAAGETMRQHAALLRGQIDLFLRETVSMSSVEQFTKRLDDLADRIDREGQAHTRRADIREVAL